MIQWHSTITLAWAAHISISVAILKPHAGCHVPLPTIHPRFGPNRILCPIYLLGGNRPEAERSLKAIKRLYPGATAFQCAAAAPLPQSDRDLVADGLESMGLVG